MYNLLVSGNRDSWRGDPWQIEFSRCVREYTDNAITEKYGALDAAAIDQLRTFPSIFAYETGSGLDPKFGVIRDITKRQDQVRIEYEIQELAPFLPHGAFDGLRFELDIGKLEMHRTHWAVKDVNLAKELHGHGIVLPDWVQGASKAVNITTHQFDVAFSFPGEVRDLVKSVADSVETRVGPNAYFYDNNYVSQLARPSLDLLLQDIYRNRSKLIVVFISADYERKNWCGIEFRAIRDIIAERQHDRIMFVRTGDGDVEGVFATDGYLDARKFSPQEIAGFIKERVDLL
jgi:hypothetical protein